MTQYVLIYHGGQKPESEEAMSDVMKAWNLWVSDMGDSLVDPGCGVGMSKTVMSDGSVQDNGGANPIAGYCILKADSEEDAIEKTKAHPYLLMQGHIEIAPRMDGN